MKIARGLLTLLVAALPFTALMSSTAAAADAPCLVIALDPGHTGTLPASEIKNITTAIRDAMQPGVPRAKVMLKEDMAAALSQMAQAGGGDLSHPDNPLIAGFQRNSVPARWDVNQLDHFSTLNVVVQGSDGFEIFNGMQQIPNGSAAALVQAATELGRQAGRQIAGKLYCLALSEHAVTIDFDRPEQRHHPFQARLSDLTGAPVSGDDVTFKVASAGGSVSPEEDHTAGGSAHTVFQMTQAESNELTAEVQPPHQTTIEDQAAITATGSLGLYIRGRHHLELAQICAAKTGPLGFLVQLAQALSPAAALTQPGEQFTCTGSGTEDDELVIPALQKTGDGSYTGTAHWKATIDTPDMSLESSQLNAEVTLVRPYSLSYDATATAKVVGSDGRHLEVTVYGWAQSVPTTGGGGTGVVTFAPNSFLGAVQQLARAAAQAGIPVPPDQAGALQNPATVPLPPDQPESAYFKLEFPITLPDTAAHQTMIVPFDVSGSDELGTYRYTIGGQIGLTAALPQR
ncbi:MAG TPA: hypothetical protein VND92_01420 [Vicinamibacterales bacterium]|nr:hypothetical protein [Vicinamibacterales bacterium]